MMKSVDLKIPDEYFMLQSALLVKKHIKYMLEFVYIYCEHIRRRKPVFHFVESFQFLPEFFKNAIVEIVNRTLNDSSLLELIVKVLDHHDTVDRLVFAFSASYTNEFSDYRFIQWATMLCTLSCVLNREGFKLALEIARMTIDIFCTRHNRFKAFASLGCAI